VAIYHFSAKVISRRANQNAVASAAYRSGDRLRDEASGTFKQYARRKERVVFKGIFAPPGSPAWVHNREALWNKVEKTEGRRNSTLCREFEASLPCELSLEQQLWLVKDFVKEGFVRRGLVADAAVHDADGESDFRNIHLHVMVPERQICRDGFTSHKDRSLRGKQRLQELRVLWESVVNRHLARHRFDACIDHRSLREQGSDHLPGVHLGYVATQIERGGGQSERGQRLRKIQAHNKTAGETHAAESGSANHRGPLAADRGAHKTADPGAVRTGGPGGGSSSRAPTTDRSEPRTGGNDRLLACRSGSAGGSARAQLTIAGWKLRAVIAAVLAELAASSSEPHEPRDYKIRTDLHGVGLLPPPAPHL